MKERMKDRGEHMKGNEAPGGPSHVDQGPLAAAPTHAQPPPASPQHPTHRSSL
eukprot:COSAG06_NODE_5706_length_3311_cov_143.553238_4_plen_53_part_00